MAGLSPALFVGENMRVYTDDGYPNIRSIRETDIPFIMLVGGRGTGKTYSALLDAYLYDVIENGQKFLYMRRTKEQLKMCCSDKYNPFRKINHERGYNIRPKKEAGTISFYDGDTQIGGGIALTSVDDVKSMDAFDTDIIIYDEFIKSRSARRMKGEAENLFNLYETVNRNRELDGKSPVTLLMLANANDSANAIFVYLKLVSIAEKMQARGKFPAIYRNDARRLMLIDFGETNKISQAKKTTALYKLTDGTNFAEMATGNKYSYNEKSTQRSRPLKEYTPVVFVGEIAIYRHKSKDLYYCTTHASGSAPTFGAGEVELQRFQKAFAWLWLSYMADKIEFEEYFCESLLTEYFRA